jgi:hypothetical protein
MLLRRRRRLLLRLAVFFAAGALLTASPLILNYVKSPDILKTDRSAGVLVLASGNRPHLAQSGEPLTVTDILVRQTKTTMAGFVAIGDASGQYGTDQPLLSPLTAALAAIGLLISLWRIRRRESLFLLLWLGLGLLLSSILIIDPPFHPRLIAVLPVPYILAARAISELVRPMIEHGRLPKLAAAGIAVLVIVQSAWFDISGYRHYLVQIDVLETEWDVIEVFERFGSRQDYYLFGGPTITVLLPGLRLFAEGRRVVVGFSPADVPRELNRDTVFIAVPRMLEHHAQLQELGTTIGARFPQTHREVSYAHGTPQLIVYASSPIGGSTDVFEETAIAGLAP